MYNVPLVIISGINNEGRNLIFGMAFVNNETEDTYNWIFKEFRRILPKEPIVFITDEDRAMQNGILNNYPETTHLVCLWHVVQNLKKHSNYLAILDGNEIKDLICSLPSMKKRKSVLLHFSQ